MREACQEISESYLRDKNNFLEQESGEKAS